MENAGQVTTNYNNSMINSESWEPVYFNNIADEYNVNTFKDEKTFNFSEQTMTVSSLRADCVVGSIARLSRENAKEYIISGNLSVNSKAFDNPSKNLNESDVISLRGYGKYIFSEVLGTTKKDRLKIIIKKYI